MTSICKSSGLVVIFGIMVAVAVTLVESGVMNNESQSVSVSSSSSITKSKPIDEAKKPSARGGKVLYTAPYSNVRVSKNEGKQSASLLSPGGVPTKFRSLTGPVLVKKGEQQPTTSTTTTTTTTTTTPSVILIDLVTEPDEERSTEIDPTLATTTVNV